MTRVFWRGVRCAWLPCEVEEGCGQSTPQCAPHIQGLRNPPHNKIAIAAVISTRSIRALSRLKSTTETKSSASKGIRVTLVIIVINSSLRSETVQFQLCFTAANRLPSFDRFGPEPQAHSLEPEPVPIQR
jgi:hypothetical protein